MSQPLPIRALIRHLQKELTGHPVIVLPRIRQVLENEAWGSLLLHCRMRYQDGILYLHPHAPAVRHELAYRTHQIKETLQQMLPDLPLRRIVLQ